MPDTTLLIEMTVLIMVIGAFAGVLAGLLGVGGGIVLVPAFFYAFQTLGYDGPIIVTSIRSVHSHNKNGAVDWAILRTWAPGIVIGAVIGMLVVAQLRTSVLQGIFGVLALVVGLYMAFGRADWRLGHAMPTGAARAALSPSVGFLSVLMGIGGGSFGVPLMSLFNVVIHRAVATAAGFGVLIAVPAVIGFLMVDAAPNSPPYTIGAVNLPTFAIVIAMTLITAPLGVKLAHAMDPKPLKRIFAVFLVFVALNMIRKSLGY